MPSSAISHRSYSVFRFSICLSVRVSVCDNVLQVCEHDILQTARENFTEFTTSVQLGTKMNRLDFEVSKIKGQGHGETKGGQKRHFGNFEGHEFKGRGHR